MKYFLMFVIGLSFLSLNFAFASCAGPYGGFFSWHDLPCHDAGELTGEQKRDWALFYHFKGPEWMEYKTTELESLLAQGYSETQIKKDWIGEGDSHVPQNYYFWQYYQLFEGKAPPDQKELVFEALPETRQTDCDMECKERRELALFGAWKCHEEKGNLGNYLCFLGPPDVDIAIPLDAENSKRWLEPITVSKWANNTIKWINFDNKVHTIVSNEGLFEPKQMSPKSAFSFTFEDKGVFGYHLDSNPLHSGNITVTSHDPSFREGEPIRRGTNNSHKTQLVFRDGLDQWKNIDSVSIINGTHVSLSRNDSLENMGIGDKAIIECISKQDLYSEQSSLILREVDLDDRLVHFILHTEIFQNTSCKEGQGSSQNLELKPPEIPKSTDLNIACNAQCKERLESQPSEFHCHKIEGVAQRYMCAQESPRNTSILLTSTDPTGEQLTFRPSELTVSIGLNNTIRWHNTGYPTTISNHEGAYDSLKFPFNEINYQVLDKPGKYVFFDESHPSVAVNVTVIPLDQDYNAGAPITKYSIFPDVRLQTFRAESDSQNFINKISILNQDVIAVTMDNTMDERYWVSDNEKIISSLPMSVGDKIVSGCTFHYDMYSRIFYHELQEINSDNNTVTFQESLGFEPGNRCVEFYENPIKVESAIRESVAENTSPLKQFKSGIPLDEIECKDGLVEAIKRSDNTPACVNLETKTKLIQRGWAEPPGAIIKQRTVQSESEADLEINQSCMTLEQSKDVAPFFKVPSYLPEGYSMKCSMSGKPSESYIIYHNKDVSDDWMPNLHMLIDDGAIFIYQYDEKTLKKFETYGSPEQRIQETYDDVMEKNPSLQPQLIKINGMVAYAVDSCPDCGTQTANFTDRTFIQKPTSTETKIKFYDEYGISYMLKTTLPLDELVLVAESLQ